MLKRSMIAALIMALSFSACTISSADSSFTYKGNKYSITDDDQVKLVKGKDVSKVVIPSTVVKNKKTYFVTSVGKAAYKNSKKLKSLVIGRYVKSIEDEAFSGASKLKKVKGGKNLARIASKAFNGDSALASFKVGKAVVSISDDAFTGSNINSSKIKTTNLKIYKPLLDAIVTDFKAGFANNADVNLLGNNHALKFSPEAGKKVQGQLITSIFTDQPVKLSDLGYAFYDIDSNGTSELLFKNKDGQIYNIYTFADGKYVTLTNFSYFFNATINTRKNIYAYNYHGAQCYDSIEYKIKGNGKDIYGVQAVTSLGSGVIRDFDYGYGSSQAFKSNKKEVDWKKMKAISLNEYLAKRDKISEEYKISDFTPLEK